jgi:hypothetical protein
MTSTFEQCPLCDNNAEYELPLSDRGNSKKFHCNKCTEFVISRAAEKHLINGHPEWRDALSEKARQGNENSILVVTTFDPPRKSEGFAYLKIEFVERKEAQKL